MPHLVVKAGVPDVVVLAGILGGTGAARTVGIDDVDRESIGEQLRVVAQKARAEPRTAHEVEERLTAANHLVRRVSPAGKLGCFPQRGHRPSLSRQRQAGQLTETISIRSAASASSQHPAPELAQPRTSPAPARWP